MRSSASMNRIAVSSWLLVVVVGCDCGAHTVEPDGGLAPVDATAADDGGDAGLDAQHGRQDATVNDRGTPILDAGTERDAAVGPQLIIDDFADQQSVPKVAALPEGGAWISYFSREQDQYRVRLQQLDVEGNKLLGARGLLISDKPADSFTMDQQLLAADDGDAILVFQDIRLGHYEGFAYRFATDTTAHWGADGLRLFGADSEEIVIDALLADDGDLVVAAERVTGDGSVLALQRVSPAGELRWGADGAQVDATVAGRTCTRPRLAPAGAGAVYLAWMDTPNLMSTQRKVLVRKLAVNGAPAWGADVELSTALDIPVQFPLQLEADGQGGLWVAWTVVEGMTFHVMLQHLDSAGAPKLGLGGPTEGIPVSTATATSQLYPALAQEHMMGELAVFWQELNTSQDRYGISGQSFSRATGERRFGGEGVVVVPASELRTTPGAARAPGGLAVVYYDSSTPLGEVSNFSAGVLELTLQPGAWSAPITSTAGAKSFGFVSRELVEATWLVWMDLLVDDGDIRATRVAVP